MRRTKQLTGIFKQGITRAIYRQGLEPDDVDMYALYRIIDDMARDYSGTGIKSFRLWYADASDRAVTDLARSWQRYRFF